MTYILVVIDMGFYHFLAIVADDLVEGVLVEQPTFAVPAEDLFLKVQSVLSETYDESVFGLSANVECAIWQLDDHRVEELFPLIVVIVVLLLFLRFTCRLVLKELLLSRFLFLIASLELLLLQSAHLLLAAHYVRDYLRIL